jgi:hypothetical protein
VADLTALIRTTWTMPPRWASAVGRLHFDPQPYPDTGGGERTKPRQLHALLVWHVDGAPQEGTCRSRSRSGSSCHHWGLTVGGAKRSGPSYGARLHGRR